MTKSRVCYLTSFVFKFITRLMCVYRGITCVCVCVCIYTRRAMYIFSYPHKHLFTYTNKNTNISIHKYTSSGQISPSLQCVSMQWTVLVFQALPIQVCPCTHFTRDSEHCPRGNAIRKPIVHLHVVAAPA